MAHASSDASGRRTLRGPRAAFTRWLFGSVAGPSVVIAGLSVDYGLVPERIRDPVLRQLSDAVALVERYDRRRLARLARGGTRIVLTTPLAQNGYVPAANVIVLDAADLLRRSRESLAVLIVHEAAHARIESLIHQTHGMSARVERRVVEEEIAFVRRLPRADEAALQAWELAKRERLERPWWTVRAGIGRLLSFLARLNRESFR